MRRGKPGPFRALVDRLGLGDSVKLLGFLPDIRPAFHAADCFVLPTYYDPCSLVVFEALACGLPVITTACNGAGELIAPGREGFVVPSPDALARSPTPWRRWPMTTTAATMSEHAARSWAANRRSTAMSHHLIRVFERAAESEAAGSPAARGPALGASSFVLPRVARFRSTRRPPRRRGTGTRPSHREPVPVLPEQTGDDRMQAILCKLAGGKGTRLRPYTAVLPKPLMPIGEVDPMPIMEVVLRQLARYGFRDVSVITGYLTELIEAFFGDGRKVGSRLTYHREVTPLGTAGGLTLLERPTESVLVINGDILTTLDFGAMYDFHQARGAAATIASYPREVKIDFGVLDFGDDPTSWPAIARSPSSRSRSAWVSTSSTRRPGTSSPPGQPLPMPDLLETMRGQGHPVHCFRQPCYWLDIGRHDDYATANEVFEARRQAFLGDPARPLAKIGRDQ